MGIIGRNDRCPCGSGQKFKKCCLPSASAEELASMASMELLKRRVQGRDEFQERESLFIQNLSGVRKMSEIVLEFAQPLLEEAQSLEDTRSAIVIAMIAWNLAFDFNSDSKEEILLLSRSLGLSKDDDASDFDNVLDNLVRRKRSLYGDVKRFIIDWDLVETSQGFNLNVVSTVASGDVDAAEIQEKLRNKIESVAFADQKLNGVIEPRMN